MYEDLIPTLKTNEPESLAIIEPFDCTFCFHRDTPFLNGHDKLRGRLRTQLATRRKTRTRVEEESVGMTGSLER